MTKIEVGLCIVCAAILGYGLFFAPRSPAPAPAGISTVANQGCPKGTQPSCWTDAKTLIMHCTCGGFGGGIPNGR
jgi:hypothetical protein